MTKILGFTLPTNQEIRGRIGRAREESEQGLYGAGIYAEADYGAEESTPQHEYDGIYQMRVCHEGRIPVKMKLYKQKYTTSVELQANRTKFTAAMTAWKALTDEQKAVYFKKAQKKALNAHNIFVKEYMLSH